MNDQVQTAPKSKRRVALIILGAVTVCAAVAWAAYYFSYSQYFEETDDAYVNGNLVQLNSQIGGTVVGIFADDTQIVQSGDSMVKLDAADTRIELERSKAALAQAVQQVSTLYVNNSTLSALITQRQAELARAEDDLKRRQSADMAGAVSAEDLGHARDAIKERKAALAAAQQQLAANRAQTTQQHIGEHPSVLAAAARLRADYLAYARSNVPAPVTGYIAKRSVQLGQRVAAGTPLMAVVPLDGVWVDANFKESQLKAVHLGQPVTLHADLYGKDVDYHGKIIGFSAGTGSAFAVLPAQNATGNWIKVVQRLPVRIALDPKELKDHPLRIGLSMTVEVDTHDRNGSQLAAARTSFQTSVFDNYGKEADAEIAAIIAGSQSVH